MAKPLGLIQKNRIFKGIPNDEFEQMLETLNVQLKHYHSHQTILSRGRAVSRAGLVLKGSVNIYQDSFWQNRTLVDTSACGEMIMSSFACVRGSVSDVTVVAERETIILWFDLYDILNLDDGGRYHTILVRNIIAEMASKNLQLDHRIIHLKPKTTKEKILSYLSEQACMNDSNVFDIPLDRQSLANYLSVERSAMSAELSKLERLGYFECSKNHFTLLQLKTS